MEPIISGVTHYQVVSNRIATCLTDHDVDDSDPSQIPAMGSEVGRQVRAKAWQCKNSGPGLPFSRVQEEAVADEL